jgi:hypothetical protein
VTGLQVFLRFSLIQLFFVSGVLYKDLRVPSVRLARDGRSPMA